MNEIVSKLLDLPNEIFVYILKELDNVDVLYSLYGITERINCLTVDHGFVSTLKLLSASSTDKVCSMPDEILDRFCMSILPNIDDNIKSLILESMSMERILRVGNYRKLRQLKIFNFNEKIFLHYFTEESIFRHIFKEQIRDLVLVADANRTTEMPIYARDVLFSNILIFFEHLHSLTFISSTVDEYLIFSFSDLPSTICFSSTLTKLSIKVSNFNDCLFLLDGRLKQLNTFIVDISDLDDDLPMRQNTGNLLNLKCFSLKCDDMTSEYDNQILPLLRRMLHLEKLTLYLWVDDRRAFIDGTHLYNEILIHMPGLKKFTFYIGTHNHINDPISSVSDSDIKSTFTKIGYENVACIVDYINTSRGVCHVFSLPFAFDRLERIGNHFPNIVFKHVTYLWVCDTISFEHEFFIRIARSFPLLKIFSVMNCEPQLSNIQELQSESDQSNSAVQYPHLTLLDLRYVHIDYIEQFLHQNKAYLPKLNELKVKYEKLKIVTNNFTREATRNNCAKVKRINLDITIVHEKQFYDYFSLL